MFGSYWEEIFAAREVKNASKINYVPVWNPVTSYLVEDSAGGRGNDIE
jgi:hypothetical protein